MKITVTFPRFDKWKSKRKANRKIALTVNQAQQITAMLEQLRWQMDLDWKPRIEAMEAVIDAQLFGQIKVNGEWVKA
jgi:Spy/CpxP family protein refolding chaperone